MSHHESTRRFDALIVDFGGVLTTPLRDSFQAFCEESGIELQHLVRVAMRVYTGGEDDLVVGFETGRISDDDFSREFARRLSEEAGQEVAPEDLLERLFKGGVLEETMLTAVAIARAAGYKTGLLSNSWGLGTYPMDRLNDMFDAIVISGQVGLRKPDRRIYELTAERLGVAPPRCVFVDDHPGHLTSAAAAGMTTVLHREPARTIAELESLLGLSLSGSS